ncbi:MAG: 4-hydroxy-3-methylbut-2-enyl diphosphate reductase [Limnochordaceae bacterium]|nr:4-hydroxy-3-methylbut-2-enyl diphosphate reductase [Limnochordaceae bacterium]
MRVMPVVPRGYCYGVVDAIGLAKKVAADPRYPRPVRVLGQIVHNRHIVEELSRLGVETLDGANRLQLLADVHDGTVIFTAHGVSPQVREAAKERGLTVVDATCPDVEKTHALVRKLGAEGFAILYIGKRGHPEPEGVLGEAPDRIYLVESAAEVGEVAARLRADWPTAPVAVTTQTTLSRWDTETIISAIREQFPDVDVYNEICLATQTRQEAVVVAAAEADIVLVVGDARSNNSNRLVQVVREKTGKSAYLIDNVQEIQAEWLAGKQTVAVTAGSSTPSQLTRQVIQWLEHYPAGVGANHAVRQQDAADDRR